MKTFIKGGYVVNEGRVAKADVLIDGEQIARILTPSQQPEAQVGETIDASGCYVLPGVIDDHVHFREPGLTAKGDIGSESRAAAAGGVTSFFDMPNTLPQTTTVEALEEKFALARQKSHVNYSFFFGATSDNADVIGQLDAARIPGVKLFMGSSTGNMLVDRQEALERLFSVCKLPLMVHCEDTATISRNMQQAKDAWGDDPPVGLHAMIRSEEACLLSTRKAIELARKYGTRLHVAHVSTAEELELFEPCLLRTPHAPFPRITAEACVGYLCFTQLDHERLGARIKVNPAIKTPVDQYMLRQALTDGRIAVVATDHAPHLLQQKQGGCATAASGMPMVQFSLPAMLELADEGVLSIQRVAELMAHQPARLFGICRRGFLREGYQADLAIVRPKSPWTVTAGLVESKCKWSPLEGHTFQWRVVRTICNGQTVYADGAVVGSGAGQELRFHHAD